MTMKLRDLIRTVRACKTAAEERAVITKESALIRTAFKDESTEYRHRNVAKLLYIHMLGYPTHFGQIECIKLLASAKFNEKRIGYLALMLLLDEKQEVLTLVTNSLQMDLCHTNQFVVGLGLTALGNIGSSEMARDLAKDVDNHLKNSNQYIRKKAALCTIRLLTRVPDLIDTFLPNVVVLLTDKNHNVLLTGVALVTAVVEIEPAYIEKFTRLVPALVKILRKLITAGYAPEYDVGGVTDPFLQVRILKLLRILGTGNASASETMAPVLAQVATNTESLKNAGNAVLYELVNTIMAIESESGLKTLAVSTLGKFLAGKDPNLKYVALETLAKVVHVDVMAVQKHRAVIVECLRDGDVSIRKRALDLVYALVNADNVKPLTKELLNYLLVADEETKPDLCVKIAAVAAQYAPTKRWQIDTLISMLHVAGNYAKRVAISTTLFLLSHQTEEHGALTHKLYTMAAAAAAGSSEAQQPLMQVAAWMIGEYGTELMKAPPMPADETSGPVGEVRTEGEVVKLLDRVLHLYYTSTETKAMVLTALLKLTARFTDAAVLTRIRRIIAGYEGSTEIELQSRSVEYTYIADPTKVPALDEHRAGLLEPMPLLDESVLRARAGAATGATMDAAGLAGDDVAMVVQERTLPKGTTAPSGSGAVSRGTDLLEGLGISMPVAAAAGGAGAGGGGSVLDDLSDLLGMGGTTRATPAASPAPAATAGSGSAGKARLDLDALFSTVATGAGDIFSQTTTAIPTPVIAPSPMLTPSPTAPLAGGAGAPHAASMAAVDSMFGAHAPPTGQPPAPATMSVSALSSTLDDIFGGGSGSAAKAPAPAPAVAAPAPAPPPAATAAVEFEGFTSAPPAIALPFHFTAYESGHIKAVFRCEKPGGSSSTATDIHATFTSTGPAVSNFICQVAPPKFLKLTLLPASGTVMGARGATSITQVIKVDNSQQGVKAIVLKLRFQFNVEGAAEQVVESTDVKGFPLGL